MKSNNKRHVLFLIPTLTGGGAERVIVTLLKYLDRSRFRLTLAVIDTRNAAYLNEIPFDVELIDIGCKRVRYALLKIIALIWKKRPDVVFSTLGHLNLALAIIRWLLPQEVFYIARETIVVTYGLSEYRFPALWSKLYRRFYRNHDLVVCQSKDMLFDLVKNFKIPKNKCLLINNPVNVDLIDELVKTGGGAHVVDSSKIRLVAAGRLVYQKGFDLLIEAISLLNDERVHLTILGEGLLLEELKALAIAKEVNNQVEFVGFQSNPYLWFARADAFVLSSRYEGFPNVLLEALACGTPVISTPAPGGTREILDNIPECAVAEVVTAESLAKAIKNWISTPQKRVPSSAIGPYALDKIVKQYEEVLA